MASGRRYSGPYPRLTRRAWEEVAPELEDFIRRMYDAAADGIPSGFNGTTPTTNVPETSGTAGLGNTTGWAAADHAHPASSGDPSGLDNAASEGTSNSFPRLDHKHKRDVRVKEDGADKGTRNAINFTTGLDAVDDPGNDRVNVSVDETELSGLTNLQLSLPKSHTHRIEDVPLLREKVDLIDSPLARRTPNPHVHPYSDIVADGKITNELDALRLHRDSHTHAAADLVGLESLPATVEMSRLPAPHTHNYGDLVGSQFLVPTGTAAAPEIAKSSNRSTGLSFPNNTTMWVLFNGVNSYSLTNTIASIPGTLYLGNADTQIVRAAAGQVRIQATGTDATGIVKAGSSQTLSLQEWQNSSGTALSKVRNDGAFMGPYYASLSGNGAYLWLDGNSAKIQTNNSSATTVIIRGMTSQAGNLLEFRNIGETILSRIDKDGQTTDFVLAGQIFGP